MPAAPFEREISVKAAPEVVWDTITDVERLVSWVSILEDVEVIEQMASYKAVLADRLGPFKLRADLDITVTDVRDGAHVHVMASGEDRQVASRIVVDATLDLVTLPEGSMIKVAGTYEVAGKVATLGAATINKKADKVLDEFFGKAQEALS